MKMVFMAYFIMLNIALAADISGIYSIQFSDVDSYVEVFKKNEKYYAVRFANRDGSSEKDTKNPNPNLRDRDLHKVVFLWNLEETKENKFENGSIYNFKLGKVMHAKAKLEGDILKVSVSLDSIGIFGRTLKWRKLSNSEVSAIQSKRLDVNTLQIPN